MEPCNNPMELKDVVSIVISLIALLFSFIVLYRSYWHKSSKALLCLNNRLYDFLGEKTKRELSYTFSNIGNQELFVKDVALLRGQSPLGNLKHNSPYLVIPSNSIDPFVIKPGEIKTFILSHEVEYELSPQYDEVLNKYILVSLEVISANGKRFQITHDISSLGPSGPDIKDKIWGGVSLGKCI
jgi:hypothetical protein